MRVVVTGGGGFIGRALVKRLLSSVGERQLGERPTQVTVVDQQIATVCADPRVRPLSGDISDKAVLAESIREGIDYFFHLAAVAGGFAEAHFEDAKRVNLDATIEILEILRYQRKPPRLVFASSIGVYGEISDTIDENTVPKPILTYGAQKLIGEVLVSDYTRRGFIDGQSVRVPAIVVRPPGSANILTGFMSEMIRALCNGSKYACPVPPDSTAWWMSRPTVVDNMIHAAALPRKWREKRTVWQLPVLRASMAEVVAGIAQLHGEQIFRDVTYGNDVQLRQRVANFPSLHCPQSSEAGFVHDGTITNMVQRALED